MSSRPTSFMVLPVVALAALLVAIPVSAADERSPAAESRLNEAATDYQRGDYPSAWFRFWSLAHEGDASAQFNLGQLYRLGVGIPTDLAIARYWYSEAAGHGHAYAQYNLGIMYELGHGIAPDPVEAQAWYRRAVARDVPGAAVALRRLEQKSRDFVPAPRPSLTDASRSDTQRRTD